MSQNVYKYSFDNKLPLKDIEESLFLAALATECLHGRSSMKLDASFSLSRKKRACVVDANTEVGRNIACIFTGFLTKEFGEKNFRVKRLNDTSQKLC